jgi:hypothetical protein
MKQTVMAYTLWQSTHGFQSYQDYGFQKNVEPNPLCPIQRLLGTLSPGIKVDGELI